MALRGGCMNITYTNTITADEVNSIRSSVGFRQIHPEQVKAGIDGSTVIVAAGIKYCKLFTLFM
jgi:hypothetical protein